MDDLVDEEPEEGGDVYVTTHRKTLLYLASTVTALVLAINLYLVHITVSAVLMQNDIAPEDNALNLYDDWKKVTDSLSAIFLKNGHDQVEFDGKDFYDDCSELWGQLDQMECIGHGWSKKVYSAIYNQQKVAVKIINLDGHDMTLCTPRNTLKYCYSLAAKKLLREIALLKILSNQFTAQVIKFCIPKLPDAALDNSSLMLYVTRLSEPVDLISTLQMPWERRLQMSLHLSKILTYLSNSPIGSLAIKDFKIEQFVISDDKLILSDVDDLSPHQESYRECITSTKLNNCSIELKREEHCRENLLNAAHHFLNVVLPHGAPHLLQEDIKSIIQSYKNGDCSTTKKLQKRMEALVSKYRSGEHINFDHTSLEGYNMSGETDMRGYHDYQCFYSISPVCAVTAHNTTEAAMLCDAEPNCKAFVYSDERSWTGRTYVYLKSDYNSSLTSYHSNMVLYYKVNNST